jgi:hypothetical protein
MSKTLLNWFKERGDFGNLASLAFATDDLNAPGIVHLSLDMWSTGVSSESSEPERMLELFVDGGDPRKNEAHTGVSWSAFESKAQSSQVSEVSLVRALEDARVHAVVMNHCSWNQKVIGHNGWWVLRDFLNYVPVWYMSEFEAARECVKFTPFQANPKNSVIEVMREIVSKYRTCEKRRRLSDYAERLLGSDYCPWDGAIPHSCYLSRVMSDMTSRLLGMTEKELKGREDEDTGD